MQSSWPGAARALASKLLMGASPVAAFALKQEIDGPNVRVLFGSYDLASRSVRLH